MYAGSADTPRRCAWLESMPGPWGGSVGIDGIHEVEFVGRRRLERLVPGVRRHRPLFVFGRRSLWRRQRLLRLPLAQVLQDVPHHVVLGDERDDLHLRPAPRAAQRVHLPDPLDALPPRGRGDTTGAVFTDIDQHLAEPGLRLALLACRLLLGPLPTAAVGVPAVVAHHLESLVRDVLGDPGDELGGRHDEEVLPRLAVGHGGVVDHHAGLGIVVLAPAIPEPT